jgi:hypothetical protein
LLDTVILCITDTLHQEETEQSSARGQTMVKQGSLAHS